MDGVFLISWTTRESWSIDALLIARSWWGGGVMVVVAAAAVVDVVLVVAAVAAVLLPAMLPVLLVAVIMTMTIVDRTELYTKKEESRIARQKILASWPSV